MRVSGLRISGLRVEWEADPSDVSHHWGFTSSTTTTHTHVYTNSQTDGQPDRQVDI